MTDKQDMGVVTQADRDAIFDWLMLTTAERYRDQTRGNVDRGEYDAMPMMSVAMFMRHRLASQADQEALIVALGNLISLAEVADVMDEPGRVTINAARAAHVLATHPQPSQKGEGDE